MEFGAEDMLRPGDEQTFEPFFQYASDMGNWLILVRCEGGGNGSKLLKKKKNRILDQRVHTLLWYNVVYTVCTPGYRSTIEKIENVAAQQHYSWADNGRQHGTRFQHFFQHSKKE